MSALDFNHTVNGVDYQVEVHFTGDAIWVNDPQGSRVADAEMDGDVEQCFYGHFTPEEGEVDGDASADLYRQWAGVEGDARAKWTPIVEWLINTHPSN